MSVTCSQPNSITVIEPAAKDPFLVPDLQERHNLYPFQIQRLGRRKTTGRVVAGWNSDTMLIETPSGQTMQISLNRQPLPRNGE